VIDDIVTRLREHALEGIWDFTKCSWDIQEAADEIELLRTQIRALEAEVSRLERLATNG
jgi:plasmid stabilization system protein ParE